MNLNHKAETERRCAFLDGSFWNYSNNPHVAPTARFVMAVRGTLMKKILIIDEMNYPSHIDEIYRVAVRGIIIVEGKLLMIESNSGELKLPGGGINDGEDDCQALVREVKEETGYDVIFNTIEPFGEIQEKRLSIFEPKLWHQISRLYFCKVNPTKGQCNYSENEIKSGFKQVLYSIEDALEKSKTDILSKIKRTDNSILPWFGIFRIVSLLLISRKTEESSDRSAIFYLLI